MQGKIHLQEPGAYHLHELTFLLQPEDSSFSVGCHSSVIVTTKTGHSLIDEATQRAKQRKIARLRSALPPLEEILANLGLEIWNVPHRLVVLFCFEDYGDLSIGPWMVAVGHQELGLGVIHLGSSLCSLSPFPI